MNGKAVNYRKGTNLPAMGDYNRSVVLETIRENSDISRIEISRMTGLTSFLERCRKTMQFYMNNVKRHR